jgi:outer membrane immunogenic protein
MGAALPYITGGLAFGDVHGWDSLTPASGSKVYVGWTVGAGIEWQLPSNWSAKIEYLYADLGKRHLFDIVPGPPPVPETVSVNVNIVRVGLNYKFGSVGKSPVVARY